MDLFTFGPIIILILGILFVIFFKKIGSFLWRRYNVIFPSKSLRLTGEEKLYQILCLIIGILWIFLYFFILK
jgi:hypothetical protein